MSRNDRERLCALRSPSGEGRTGQRTRDIIATGYEKTARWDPAVKLMPMLLGPRDLEIRGEDSTDPPEHQLRWGSPILSFSYSSSSSSSASSSLASSRERRTIAALIHETPLVPAVVPTPVYLESLLP